jgi:hypothetical protein
VPYLILDRDPLYTGSFQDLLRDSGVTPLRLPARSPNLNAFAERFVGTVKAECLGRIVPLGEGHLRAAVRSFVDHYHEERPRQGLDNALVAPQTTSIRRGPMLGAARRPAHVLLPSGRIADTGRVVAQEEAVRERYSDGLLPLPQRLAKPSEISVRFSLMLSVWVRLWPKNPRPR